VLGSGARFGEGRRTEACSKIQIEMGHLMATLSMGQITREALRSVTNREMFLDRVRKQAERKRTPLVLGAQAFLGAVSYALAVSILAEARGAAWTREVLSMTVGLMVLIRLAGSASVGLYRRSIRYASAVDMVAIAKSTIGSSIAAAAILWWLFPQLKLPAAVFIADCAFLQLSWGGLHFGARVLKSQQAVARIGGKRVVIVGAGDAGMSLLKELALDPGAGCSPVAVVDDDPQKWGRTMYGVPVVPGGIAGLDRVAAESRAEEILICIPSASPLQMREILRTCRHTGIPVRTLPSLAELIGGIATPRALRSPRIEDLLERDEIPMDSEGTRKLVSGKVVLVTGAGGSIGSELCRQIADAGPSKLLLLDKSENSLFYVNLEATERLGAERVKPLLVDLTNRDRVTEIVRSERPEVVFHAAAHKHVGLLELHPQEAIRNNVVGTRNIAEAALAAGASRFVNISTDKAVNPRNYMGLSKKLTELCMQELARNHQTRFMNVRFGNVAGSTGSVLRIFWDQIQKGGPIRITDPRATRYFMSIREAVNLILRAAALGEGGETFVFDMGEPVNIYDLAKKMALFAGKTLDKDLPIEFTGLADGEKITEELWEDWERPQPSELDRILVIREANPLSRGILQHISAMEEFIKRGERGVLLAYLRQVVPGFKHVQPFAVPFTPPPVRAESVSVGAA
jgi:FlaA1/EpsC-like NDP-sugar epimerase